MEPEPWTRQGSPRILSLAMMSDGASFGKNVSFAEPADPKPSRMIRGAHKRVFRPRRSILAGLAGYLGYNPAYGANLSAGIDSPATFGPEQLVHSLNRGQYAMH